MDSRDWKPRTIQVQDFGGEESTGMLEGVKFWCACVLFFIFFYVPFFILYMFYICFSDLKILKVLILLFADKFEVFYRQVNIRGMFRWI